MLQKTDVPGMFKNDDTGVIVNKDINKLEAYRKQKKLLSKTKQATEEVKEMKNELTCLKEEMNSIKDLLIQLNNKIKKDDS